jgi:signal transduction histidine kinase
MRLLAPELGESGEVPPAGPVGVQPGKHKRKQMSKEQLEKDDPGTYQAFHQSIIDGVADPIMVIDPDYRIILMNRAAKKFAGDESSRPPLLCYQLSHHLPAPCNDIGCPCPLEQVRTSGQTISVIHEHCQAGGEKRIFEVNATPLASADGKFMGIIESMRDITERHQREKALRQYMKRLRALTSQLAELSETERRRLSQELHDRVGQNLTALGINLNIIRAEVSAGAPAPLLSRLDDSISLVEQTTQRIRDVMADLRPPVLDDYGLVAALKWNGRRFNQRTNIAVRVDGEELTPRLIPRLENVLFRIAQEALTNVAKHAQAEMVVVTVKEDASVISLIVADDGIGFNPTPIAGGESSPGWGIITMMERAEAEGARCRIESRPNGGTRVIVEVKR